MKVNKKLLFSGVLLLLAIFGVIFSYTASAAQPVTTKSQTVSDSGDTKSVTIGLGPDRYYSPRDIRVKAGTKVILSGDANTLTGCMIKIIVENYGSLVAGGTPLEFVADKPGTYRISCPMGMGGGRLLVEDANGNVPGSETPIQTPTHSCGGGCGGCGG